MDKQKGLSMDPINERRSTDLVLQQHTVEEIERYEDLKRDIKALQDTVESLVEAWNQARGAISLIKWIVGISGSLAAFILFIKDHIK
jgi:hypothetical protein